MHSKFRSGLGEFQKPLISNLYVCDAANTASGVADVGDVIDLQDLGTQPYDRVEAAVLNFLARCTLGAAATATFDFTIEHAPAVGGPFVAVTQADLLGTEHEADALPGAAALVVTDPGPGGENDGELRFSFEASRLDRFLRVTVECTLSVPAADQAVISSILGVKGRLHPSGEAAG